MQNSTGARIVHRCMSYLYIALIGGVTGGLVGYFVTGSREAMVVDLIAGAIGAWIMVVLCRVIAPAVASGTLISVIAAVTGAIITLFLMNRLLRGKLMSRSRR